MSAVVSSQDTFTAAVEAIYGAAASPAQWPDALRAIAECTDDAAAILIYRRPDQSSALIMSPGHEQATEAYNRYWWQHDLRLARSAERGFLIKGDTITDRHVVTDEEIATHPFYGFLREHDLGWFAGTTVSPATDEWVGFATIRTFRKQAFTDAELALHTRLGRHVENALRLGIRLIDTEMASLAFADALSRLGVGVFLLDGLGDILFSNSAANALTGDGLLIARGRLMANFANEREALELALLDAANAHPGQTFTDPKPVLVRNQRGDRFLAVYALPARLPTGHPAEAAFANVRTLLVVTASDPGKPVDPTLIRDLLGLTLGESRVAALVGAGAPPREAAERLGITEQTARTTLKRVFEKMGVSRQSELVALMTRLVMR